MGREVRAVAPSYVVKWRSVGCLLISIKLLLLLYIIFSSPAPALADFEGCPFTYRSPYFDYYASVAPTEGNAPLQVNALWSLNWSSAYDRQDPTSWSPIPLYEIQLYLEWGDGSEVKIPFQDCPQPFEGHPGYGSKNWPAKTLSHTYPYPGTYQARVRYEQQHSTPGWLSLQRVVVGGGAGGHGNTPVASKNLGPSCSASVGNPINVEAGNKFEVETDFMGGPSTLLGITRSYNSQATGSTAFGALWTSTYHRSLSFPSATEARVTRPDGKIFTYRFNGAVWASDPDVIDRLLPAGSGSGQTGWKLTNADDSTENYSLSGKLTSIVTRAGLAVNLAYDANDRLATVTGPFGHKLTYAYDTASRIAAITAPDGGIYRYAYGANNNLTSVTYPDNKVKNYVYENAAFPNALTGIIDEKNTRFATFDYDAVGRAVSTVHAGGVEKYTVDYQDQWTSKVTDGLGRSYSYSLMTQFGDVKPQIVNGQCPTC